jgi:translation initiation factor 2B subunit (eIF-2B alpha/beta/delta family)
MATKEVLKDDSAVLKLSQSKPSEILAQRGSVRTTLPPQAVSIDTVAQMQSNIGDFDWGSTETLPEPNSPDDYLARTLASLRRIPSFSPHDWQRIKPWLSTIVKDVFRVWQAGQPIPHIPAHGPEHNLRIIEALCNNFPDELLYLSEKERLLLLAAAWLYDIGMVHPGDLDDYSTKLEHYSERSAEYAKTHAYRLGLAPDDQKVISNLCKYHAQYEHLPLLEMMNNGRGLPVNRQKLLLAFLRLGELLEVRAERVKGKSVAFLANLPINVPVHVEVYNSFLRNLFIDQIRRDGFALRAQVNYPPDWRPEEIDNLITILKDNLQEALDKIKDVLLTERGPFLVDVEAEAALDHSIELRREKAEARRNLVTTLSPNGGQVVGSIIAALEELVLMEAPDIPSLSKFVETDLASLVNLRPNHAQLRNLREDLASILASGDDTTGKIRELKECIEHYKTAREQAHKMIGQLARERFVGECCFLVIGYSDCVMAALQGLSPETREQSDVIVLESRIKTVYGTAKAFEYNDGLANSLAIRRLGFRNVSLIPDGAIAAVYENSEIKPPTHVLLGINTIRSNGDCYNTVGTTTVAIVAKEHKTRVYILAESKKIRETEDDIPKNRRNQWLTNDPRILDELTRNNINVFNPLHERLPAALITGGIITEKGLWDLNAHGRSGPDNIPTPTQDRKKKEARRHD